MNQSQISHTAQRKETGVRKVMNPTSKRYPNVRSNDPQKDWKVHMVLHQNTKGYGTQTSVKNKYYFTDCGILSQQYGYFVCHLLEI